MGTIISLGIKKMEIDWGKNHNFRNYSKLYNIKEFNSQIPYYDIDDDDNEILKYEMGASAKLGVIKDRLDLLGYNINSIKSIYYKNIKEYEYYMDTKITLSFKDFYEFILSLDVDKVDTVASTISEYRDDGYDLGEYFRNCICKDVEIDSKLEKILKKIKTKTFIIGEVFEAIDSYIILRILAENPKNLNYNVEWRYNELVENGWVKKEDLFVELDKSDKLLIVTEGKTDSFIIKKIIQELYPHISNFFTFVDMQNNYPFTGTGNLSNFCKGLYKINAINKIIAIFDNDTAGIFSYNETKKICNSSNILVMHLPNVKELKRIKTRGPKGCAYSNINGKAVAIECFLDFKSVDFEPEVRWLNYNDKMGQYQGALINKDEYTRAFKNANLHDGSYDVTKLQILVESIMDSWINNNR